MEWWGIAGIGLLVLWGIFRLLVLLYKEVSGELDPRAGIRMRVPLPPIGAWLDPWVDRLANIAGILGFLLALGDVLGWFDKTEAKTPPQPPTIAVPAQPAPAAPPPEQHPVTQPPSHAPSTERPSDRAPESQQFDHR